jgi:alkyl hydroperoxide reductase subunit AhpC
MPGLNLGDTVPDFDAETSMGPIKFHEWIGDRCVLPAESVSSVVS